MPAYFAEIVVAGIGGNLHGQFLRCMTLNDFKQVQKPRKESV